MPDAAVLYEREGTVGRVVIDVPGKPVNVLSRAVLEDLARAVEAAERDGPGELRIVSGKKGSFVAGADIFELRSLSADELDAYLKFGQALFDRIERLPMPATAEVEGACLGGGLELAMACGRRTFADSPKPVIGLPETTLGLVPGWGGTVRLPRLIGVAAAAEMIVSGKPIAPARAKELGLDQLSRGLIGRRSDLPSNVPDVPPAPRRAVEVMRVGLADRQAGLDAERAALIELRDSVEGRNLLRLFALKQGAKKRAVKAAGGEPREVRRVVVFGGGTMGAGIAYALLRADLDVATVEADAPAAEAAWQRLTGLVRGDMDKGRLSAEKGNAILDRADLGHAADAERLVGKADLVVEAVVEDLEVKRRLFADLGRWSKKHAVLATNTSSLPVAELAEASWHPKRVVGLHWFNPVAKMPLVEVVRGDDSSDPAVATAVSVALAAGKTPVVVRDAPGFVVNRVLFPYLSEAMRMLADGIDPATVDATAVAWRMPMGPVALIDTIGLDVTLGVCEALHPHCGGRVEALPILREKVRAGDLGRKTGRGFYDGKPPAGVADPSLADRLILPMVNEARRVLAENVVESADDLDLACVLGLGIAGHRGGPAAYDRDEPDVTERLEALAREHGDRFAPAGGAA